VPSHATPCLALPSLVALYQKNSNKNLYYCESSPCLALPRQAMPGPVAPSHAAPSLASPGRARPRPASPCQAYL